MPAVAMAVVWYESAPPPGAECATAAALASGRAYLSPIGHPPAWAPPAWVGDPPGWAADPRRRVISRASLALAPGRSVVVRLRASTVMAAEQALPSATIP